MRFFTRDEKLCAALTTGLKPAWHASSVTFSAIWLHRAQASARGSDQAPHEAVYQRLIDRGDWNALGEMLRESAKRVVGVEPNS
jgi:hypothetical protein